MSVSRRQLILWLLACVAALSALVLVVSAWRSAQGPVASTDANALDGGEHQDPARFESDPVTDPGLLSPSFGSGGQGAMRPLPRGARPLARPASQPGTEAAFAADPASCAQRLKRLALLRACVSEDTPTPACAIAGGDRPDSRYQRLVFALARELRALRQQSPGGPLAPEVAATAREFARFPDDFVKEEAMALIGMATPAPENRDALLDGLSDSVSAPLFEMGLVALRPYRGDRRVGEFVLRSVQHGGHFAAIAVARDALPFMTAENASSFAKLARRLPERDPSRRYLEWNLREFRRMQRGG